MTFYLKYRPQTIEQLDLWFVREQLQKILSSDHFPHAFLFSGPKGLGKTSAARILAKTINCKFKVPSTSFRSSTPRSSTVRLRPNRLRLEEADASSKFQPKAGQPLAGKVQIEPCNQCEVCRSVNAGTALDLLEIDAASNRGIDDIRLLRERIKLSPTEFKYKVYVIDEVHMLTQEAFNALLKTLEEPPEHAIFILATTEPQKLPATIISRCLHIKFKKATINEIVRSLQRIVKGEALEVNDKVLQLIARQAEGSFRDAAKILEQFSFSGNKITLTQAESLINQGGGFDLASWLDLLLTKDTEGCLRMLQEATTEGIDLKWLIVQSLERLRQLLLGKYELTGSWLVADGEWMGKEKVEKLKIEELVYLMELLNRAGVGLKNSIIPQLPLELAIVEWSTSPRHSESRFNRDEESPVNTEKSHLAFAEPACLPVRQVGRQGRASADRGGGSFGPSPPIGGSDPQDDVKSPNIKIKIEDVAKNWEKVLLSIRPHNHSVEALLRSSRPLRFESNTLVIEAFYQFHKERLENEKCHDLVEKVLKDVFGEQFKVKYLLGKRKTQTKVKKGVKKDGELLKAAEEIFMRED